MNAFCNCTLLRELRHSTESITQEKIISLSSQMLAYAMQAADLYWTPGYLILAYVCQEMSLHPFASYFPTQEK